MKARLTDYGIIVSDDWKSAGKAADVWNGGKPILGLGGRPGKPSSCDSLSRAFVFGNQRRGPGGPSTSGNEFKGAASPERAKRAISAARAETPVQPPDPGDPYWDEMAARQREIGSKFWWSGGGGAARRKPGKAVRDRILKRQGDRCLYCEHKFGDTVWRRGQQVTLRLNWDHLIPYAYLAANPDDNWVAACHVCNGIKSSAIFQSVQEARDYILARAAGKGYRLGSHFAVAA
jgi:hypothetical protein